METSAMGGDSHIWVQSGNINIGPRRVIPLCRAAVLYPDIMNALKKRWIPDRLKLNEHIQATKFFIRTKQEPANLSWEEGELLALIQYFTNWIEKSFSFIPISKYFSVKCLKS
jgi:N-methylhydantoinase A/oxoprolinase/acetone carboxylase beta subunit